MVSLCGGLKPPLFGFILQENTKKMITWKNMVGAFKRSARVFFNFQNNVCFHILISLIVTLTKLARWRSGKWRGCASLGPGFDSQVPPKFYVIFHIVFLYSFTTIFHHGLQRSACQVSQKIDPKARDGSTPCSKSMSVHMIPRVNVTLCLMGFSLLTKPSILAQHPYGSILFSFVFFSFF